MYQTVWSDLKDDAPENVERFVEKVEREFINEDAQLHISQIKGNVEVTFTVVNDSREKSTSIFNEFERMATVNSLDYSIKTTQESAVLTVYGVFDGPEDNE